MIVTTSVARSTSASLWLTSTTACWSRATTSRMAANSRSLSCGVSTDVGSSSTTTRGLRRRHLISSTRWRSPADRSPTTASGSIGEPVVLADLGDEVAGPAPVEPRRRRRARTFSHTVSGSTRLKCWCTMPMPRAAAACGSAMRRGTPSSTTRPSSGWTRPIRTFISVDLPAPFSPSTPCTSPAREREVDAVARHDRAVALGDPLQLAHEAGVSVLIPARVRAPDRRQATVSRPRTPRP